MYDVIFEQEFLDNSLLFEEFASLTRLANKSKGKTLKYANAILNKPIKHIADNVRKIKAGETAYEKRARERLANPDKYKSFFSREDLVRSNREAAKRKLVAAT